MNIINMHCIKCLDCLICDVTLAETISVSGTPKTMPDHGEIDHTAFAILAQCSANLATRSGRFEYVIFRNRVLFLQYQGSAKCNHDFYCVLKAFRLNLRLFVGRCCEEGEVAIPSGTDKGTFG